MTTIKELVADRVESGEYKSSIEAGHALLAEITEEIIDSGIARGREDVENGRVIELTPEGEKKILDKVLN